MSLLTILRAGGLLCARPTLKNAKSLVRLFIRTRPPTAEFRNGLVSHKVPIRGMLLRRERELAYTCWTKLARSGIRLDEHPLAAGLQVPCPVHTAPRIFDRFSAMARTHEKRVIDLRLSTHEDSTDCFKASDLLGMSFNDLERNPNVEHERIDRARISGGRKCAGL
ncbi:hypothetical protein K438DRAFT_1934981 [Mycena galopus ATCC 62051]|nr:hypothetical protein K438DRAFT_1934981 [Mycena galopus ATCC 62051]